MTCHSEIPMTTRTKEKIGGWLLVLILFAALSSGTYHKDGWAGVLCFVVVMLGYLAVIICVLGAIRLIGGKDALNGDF